MIVLNGKLMDEEMLYLDRGFLFGCGVFETLLIKKNRPIFLGEHLERLNKGLQTLNIATRISENEVLQEIEKLQAKDCALRISVSDKNFLVTKREIPYNKADYEKGFSLKVSDITRNPKSHITYIKSFNYIDNGLEKERAVQEGFNEAIFLNDQGLITEGCTTNLFWVKNNILYTPSVECGLLEGVMRNWIIKQSAVIQGHFTLDDVLNSEGVFVTNSLIGIMKVSQIGYTAINQHPMTQTLQKAYTHYLEACCHE